jgi:glycosyltransferase involved in cell wall biosynthesis
MTAPTLCLNMIVKNEAHVIRRCLDSVLAHVDHWVVVDTGSSDGTQSIIRDHMHAVPGELFERPWRDFGWNRSEALQLARAKADYVLVMDADHVLHVPPTFSWSTLDADGYLVSHRYAGVDYGLPILLADRIPWRYEGVLHEYVTADLAHTFVPLEGPWIEVFHEGARSRDPQTYLKDAAILEQALAREPGNARYAYYLAQSWKDAGVFDKALAAFRHRASMQGWVEETWHATYQAAQLVERLGFPPSEIEHAYLACYNARPTRAEPLVHLARWHRTRQEWGLAFLFARAAAATPRPADRLFLEETVYTWRALDELAISAWYAGFREEGKAAAARLLKESAFPAADRPRMEQNLKWYESSA